MILTRDVILHEIENRRIVIDPLSARLQSTFI
jgi:hypothetical protein